MLLYRNFNTSAHPQNSTAMLILLNATSKHRLLKSIKITGAVGIALAMQACSSSGQRPASPGAKSLQKTQCIREIPARYQTINKKSLIAPETPREEVIPAQYQTVLRWVLEENGRAQSREMPAKQIALPFRSVQQGPQVTTKTRAPEVRDIPVKVHTGTPQMVWRRV